MVPGASIDLVPAYVALDSTGWQAVRIPIGALVATGPVTAIEVFVNFGGTVYLDEVCLTAGPAPATAVTSGSQARLPQAVDLAWPYPNPFNSSTTIAFSLPAPGPVRLAVYDVLGRQVAVLVEGQRSAAAHTVVWDGRDSRGRAAASGVYAARLRAAGVSRTTKLLLLR